MLELGIDVEVFRGHDVGIGRHVGCGYPVTSKANYRRQTSGAD
jgi:hypothetical protein